VHTVQRKEDIMKKRDYGYLFPFLLLTENALAMD